MTTKKLRFAIFGNVYNAEKSASVVSVLSFLNACGAEISIDREFHDFISGTLGISLRGTTVIDGDNFDADFVISMGGDGTFLKAAERVADKNIPIIGVKMGRLGFLADIDSTEIEESLKDILNGDYRIKEREVIMVESDGKTFESLNCAVNDIAILKRDTASMISIRVSVNGEYLTTYLADGLIVSTSTGSTAYSLSNGGPIIVPGTNVFSLTAVAPHSLNIRPIVIADTAVITLEVESRSNNFLVAIDGRSEHCTVGETLTLRRAPYNVRIVKRSRRSYFTTLREKMMWGADARKE